MSKFVKRTPTPSLHPAAALLAAAALHTALLLLAGVATTSRSPHRVDAARPATEVEVSLLEPEVSRERATSSAPAGPAVAVFSPTTPRPLTRLDAAPATGQPSGQAAAEVPPVLDSPQGQAAPFAPRKRVDIGLGGSLSRQLVLQGRGQRKPSRKQSAGRLAEELDARDAAKGLGRASVALAEAQRAALGLAPPSGVAVFDVRADRNGQVASVTLVSFGGDTERWQRVRQALHRQLKRRRLQVPPGSRGVSWVLRVERGEIALEAAERGRTKRGVALGQDSLGPRDRRDESTRASETPGRVSPTLGTSVAGGSTAPTTRVVLLRESVL